jgi:hypothetical protein
MSYDEGIGRYRIKCKKHGSLTSDNDDCPLCLKESDDEARNMQSEKLWNIAPLCSRCPVYDYDDGSCFFYPKMPIEFFGRKKKCKHSKQAQNLAYYEDNEIKDIEV